MNEFVLIYRYLPTDYFTAIKYFDLATLLENYIQTNFANAKSLDSVILATLK